ncbi:MAG TPA: hypothetical protein VIM44_01905, partial [Rariglobus sp.]
CVLCAILGGPSLDAAGYGFDVLTRPAPYAHDLAEAGLDGRQGTWMRVRGLVDPTREGVAGEVRSVTGDRAGLQALHDRGIRTAVLLRWSPSDWTGGVRAGGGQRHPLDLREAFERGRRLGATYGDLVDVWEIENEPDIDFVAENPETHAAFQKAVYLGLHAGVQSEAKSLELRAESSGWRARRQGRSPLNLTLSSSTRPTSSRVLMAPLALPPGPYFERLWANGLASYTDGFNFHYYGYADDFTGVYRQFEDAIGRQADRESRVQSLESRVGEAESWATVRAAFRVSQLSTLSSGLEPRKRLPVFITEYGYGSLDGEARNTVEGRVRQWRWFASLAKQIRALRPEGPMAFLFNPYYEVNLNEFGLLATIPKFLATSGPFVGPDLVSGRADGAASRKVRPYIELASGSRLASGQQLATSVYTPSDFGENRPQPWMARIGQKVGESYASPALAYLWDYAERHPYRARDWTVRATPPSPVVIDFVADENLVQAKRSGGYAVKGFSPEWSPVLERFGRGRLVVYNLGAAAVSGELVITDPTLVVALPAAAITLAPGERREVPLQVRVSGESWEPRTLGVRFWPKTPGVGGAVFSMRLFSDTGGMAATTVANFEFPATATRERGESLRKRPLATGEQGLQPDGRWLVTDGVRVEEREGVWRFHIDALPEEPLRSAMVELPLPAGFVFNPGTLLMLQGRIVPMEDGG